MILIALGGNLPSAFGDAVATLNAALSFFKDAEIFLRVCSPFYRTAPVPSSDQPWFVNAVAVIETAHPPEKLLHVLMDIEKKCGRVRGEKNAARTLDLDVLDYNGMIVKKADVELPHPRLTSRAFVLYPLRDVAPHWQHPVTGQKVDELIAAHEKNFAGAQALQKMDAAR